MTLKPKPKPRVTVTWITGTASRSWPSPPRSSHRRKNLKTQMSMRQLRIVEKAVSFLSTLKIRSRNIWIQLHGVSFKQLRDQQRPKPAWSGRDLDLQAGISWPTESIHEDSSHHPTCLGRKAFMSRKIALLSYKIIPLLWDSHLKLMPACHPDTHLCLSCQICPVWAGPQLFVQYKIVSVMSLKGIIF